MVAVTAQCIASEAHIDMAQPLRDRLLAAMAIGRHHWMITDEDERFRASIGAVLLSATEDEREQIAAELRALRNLSALIEGLPIDPARLALPEEPIGLLRLWKEPDGLSK